MTALQEYQRLECTGLWRETPEAQRREVIVSFGDATLVISDAKNARALTHWSLPAVLRLNPGERPALFTPGPDAGEELEIDDETLIEAVAKVHTIIEARRPHPGRLRVALLSSTLAAILGVGLFWMPGVLIDHTASALPAGKRQEIGLAALADLTRLSGTPCNAPEGSLALEKLRDKLMPPGGRIYILRDGVARANLLPGPIVLLGRGLIEDQPTADAAAGHIIAEQLRDELTDPMLNLLRYAGLRASFELLTTGDLPEGALTGYGEKLLTQSQNTLPEADLMARFAATGIPSAPYKMTHVLASDGAASLGSADPNQVAPSAQAIIADSDWVAIQSICSG